MSNLCVSLSVAFSLTAQLQAALDVIEKEYTEFRSDGVGRLEFPLAKRFFKRVFTKQRENPVSIAFQINSAMQNGFRAEYLWNFEGHLDSISRADTNKFIGELFPEYENLLKVIVTPDANAIEGACVISKMQDAGSCF